MRGTIVAGCAVAGGGWRAAGARGAGPLRATCGRALRGAGLVGLGGLARWTLVAAIGRALIARLGCGIGTWGLAFGGLCGVVLVG